MSRPIPPLRDLLAWCHCAGRIVILDLAADRYLCLRCDEPPPGDAQAATRPPMALTVWAGPRPLAGPPVLASPLRDLGLADNAAGTMAVLAAAWAQRRAIMELRRRHLADILVAFEPVTEGQSSACAVEAPAIAIAAAHAGAGRWQRSADRCLARSIAVLRACRARRLDACITFGVRVDPFAAHCWVQSGDAVLVGDIEQVRRFTPILALR